MREGPRVVDAGAPTRARMFLALALAVAAAATLAAQSAGGDAQATAAVGTDLTSGAAGGTDGEGGSEAAEPAGDAAAKPALTREQEILELDLSTSTLQELAALCRERGLSEGGAREELLARLRTALGLPAPAGTAKDAGDGGARSISVESARTTEYFTLEAVDEEYARLKGGVRISLKDGNVSHVITADEILYNRTRNILSAAGSVEYVKTADGSVDTFRGDTLTMDADSWVGAFLGGASERSAKAGETAYSFSAAVISRSSEDVTVLDDAVVRTVGKGDPAWSLAATKIWLLPGAEWAVLNAVLKVGEVPLLYIPFFYLPGDEMVFHPVLGYRSREGNFLQTTTYLLGRPKRTGKGSSSIMKVLEGDPDGERKRNGLYLVKTGKRAPPSDGASFSVLFDAYANLGAFVGFDAVVPKTGFLTQAAFSVGAGFTRDVYKLADGTYSPFAKEDGSDSWNRSYVFGASLPARLRVKTSGSLKVDPFSLSWEAPFYSDPYVDQDFMNRSEDMDLFNLLKQGAAAKEENAAGVLGSYSWRISSSASLPVKGLEPFVGSASLSKLSSSVQFNTKNSVEFPSSSPSPSRSFYYPSRLTFIAVEASVSGKALDFPGTRKTPAPTRGEGEPDPGYRSPWPAEDKKEASARTDGSADSAERLRPSPLAKPFSFAPAADFPGFVVSYSFAPAFSSEADTRSSLWKEAEDVRWDSYSSVLNVAKGSGEVKTEFSLPGRTAVATVTLTGSGAHYNRPYINEEAEEFDSAAERDAARLRDFRSTNFDTKASWSLALKPFANDPVWGGSSLQHSLSNCLLAKTDFKGTADDPRWDILRGEWDKKSIGGHKLSVNAAASVFEKNQSASLTFDLPPHDAALSAVAAVRAGASTTTANVRVADLESKPRWEPLTVTESLSFGKSATASQSATWDFISEDFKSISASLSLGAFSSSFSAQRDKGYSLVQGKGWVVDDATERLRPKALSTKLKIDTPLGPWWERRVSASVRLDSGLELDLQRFTQSSFSFNLTGTLKVFEFLDLSLTMNSQNSAVYRYLSVLPAFDLGIDVPGQKNPFLDLLDSFKLWDEAARRSTGFKLKSLSVKATHYMGDWKADLSYAFVPYLDTSNPLRYEYRYAHDIGFLVQWVPVSEFKTEIKKDRTGFAFK